MCRAARASVRSRLLASSVWVLAATAALPAAAAPDAVQLEVTAGTLDAALTSLAMQTHQQVLYTADLVANRRAPALKGFYTPDEALTRLLAGSGIVAKRTGPNVLVLQSVSAARGQPAGSATSRPFDGDAAPEAIETAPRGPGIDTGSRVSLVAEVTVTGSNLRGAAPASPVVTLSREDLERSGHTTVADALRALPANFTGGAQESFGTGGDRLSRNGAFASSLNLRGLGNNATLILLNGRRMAGSGTFGDFVDISTLPTAAVERVEVLLDGASALYGSDAVGGVVNIIMRKDYQGAETRLLGAGATAGEPLEAQFSQTVGRRWASGGFVASYEFRRRENLSGEDRDFAADADLRPLGGIDQRQTISFPGNILVTDPVTRALAPGYAIPPGQNGVGLRPSDFVAGTANRQNQRQGADVLPKQTLHSVYLAGDQALGGSLVASGDLRWGNRRFRNVQLPGTSTFTVGRGNPFFVSPTGASSHQIAYSFADDVPNPVASGSADTLAASLGAKLALPHGWRSEGYVAAAQEIDENRTTGIVNSLILGEALGNTPDNPATAYSPSRHGYFNPFNGIAGANDATVSGFIASGFLYTRSRSRVISANLQADGPLWDLPGGAVKLALGAQARRETYTRTNTVYAATAAPALNQQLDLSRNVGAMFAEAQVPLFGEANARPGFERLTLSLAGRIEHYEAVGATANPKLGVLWSPTDGLQMRATYGRSFRAPGLREVAEPELYNPQLLALGPGRVVSLTLAGGNPDLKPETATSWTVGFDLRPTAFPGLSLSATGFDIRFKNRIERPVSSNLANALQDPSLAAFVTRISPGANAADLARIQALLASPALSTLNGVFAPEAYGAIVDNRYVNTSALRVRGIDVSARYRFDVGDDEISLSGDATYMLDFKQQLTPTLPLIERVGVMNFPVRFRSRLTANWTRGRLTLGGAFNWTSAYHDTAGVRVEDQPTFDLQARLAATEHGPVAGVTVLLSVRNVLDRDPPFYNNSLGIGYDGALGDPVGRYLSLQITRAW